MNVAKEMDYFNGEDQQAIMRGNLTAIFGECEALCAYGTKQFKQYSAYVNYMLDPEPEKESEKQNFQRICKMHMNWAQDCLRNSFSIPISENQSSTALIAFCNHFFFLHSIKVFIYYCR